MSANEVARTSESTPAREPRRLGKQCRWGREAEPAVETALARFSVINGQAERLTGTMAPSAIAKKHRQTKQRWHAWQHRLRRQRQAGSKTAPGKEAAPMGEAASSRLAAPSSDREARPSCLGSSGGVVLKEAARTT